MFRNPRGYYNAAECWQLSLTALDRIAVSVGRRPGRKLIVWIGPGWSAFARLAWLTTNNQQQGLFDYIAVVATALREARITLYSIDPAGVGHGQFYYENYLKGVATVKQVDYRDLLLQVLAQQTGGLVFFGTNDIASLIDRCTADANAYYILSFNPPPASHPNEYHSIEVQIDKPGMRARTRTGYYAQP
jgi:VWFA-related protein